MRKIQPTIIVIRRDNKRLIWVRDHYDIKGDPDEDFTTSNGDVTYPTGFDSGEDAWFIVAMTADVFPHASIIISPPEPRE